jgi:hypothetical protein
MPGILALAVLLSAGEAAASFDVGDRPTPTPLWGGLLDHGPVPIAADLPATTRTTVDGVYARHSNKPPQWWSCLRCADYRPAGGTWRILLDRGVLRILYDVTAWRTLASYEIDGDRLRIFNDPICPWEEGLYRWELHDGSLRLHVVEDTCGFGLRSANLTAGPWLACAPPDLRAAASDAWSKPPGCAPARIAEPPDSPPSVEVRVASGDARKDLSPLKWLAPANADNVAPPDGIVVARHPGAVPYGLNVVLWKGGDWAEVTVDLATEAIGVQFWGPSSMGIARLLFDGEEVWRGEVSQLGRYLQLYGGYVEVTGYSSGVHRLRVEHLGADDRPVTVLFFGGR